MSQLSLINSFSWTFMFYFKPESGFWSTLDPQTFIIWAALHEKVPNVLSRCHTKRRMHWLKILVWHWLERKKNKKKNFSKIFKKKQTKKNKQKRTKSKNSVSYQKKDGWVTRPSFWYDNNSSHKGPFCVTPPIYDIPSHVAISSSLF